MKNSIKKTISIAFSVLFVITCYMSTLMTANAVNESADSNTFNYINRLVDLIHILRPKGIIGVIRPPGLTAQTAV